MMLVYMLKSKKSQFWYADFLIAVLILVLISYLFISSINQLNKKQDKFQSISSDSLLISSTLMSEGYCVDDNCEGNWRNLLGNIGFVENGKVIQDNLKALISLTSTSEGYNISKILLGTRNNYIFYFEDSDDLNSKITISGETKNIYGYYKNPPITEVSQINAESYVRTTRFVYLENVNTKKIAKLVVIVW